MQKVNMRKIALFIFALFLFSIIPVIAQPYNWGNDAVIFTGSTKDRLKAFPTFDSSGNWYFQYHYTDDLIRIRKLDSSFNLITQYAKDCDDPSDGCYQSDCNFGSHPEQGNIIDCLTSELDTNQPSFIYRFWYNNDSFETLFKSGILAGGKDIRNPAVVNDYFSSYGTGEYLAKLWMYTANVYPRYTNKDYLDTNLNGEGQWDFNSPQSTTWAIDLQFAWCNNNYIVISNNADGLLGFVHEQYWRSGETEPLYKNTYDFQPNGWGLIGQDQYSIWVNDDADVIHIVTNDITNKLTHFQVWSCNGDNTLTKIDELEFTYSHNEIENSEIYESVGLPDDLQLWFRMNDTDSNITDYSIYGRDGTYYGGEYQQSSVFDHSLGFDNVDDNITVGDVLDFTITDDFSFTGWVKLNDVQGSSDIVAKYDYPLQNGYVFWVKFGYLYLELSEDSTHQDQAQSGSIIPANEWVFVAVTYNGTNDPEDYVFYINGVEQTTVELSDDNVGDITNAIDLTISTEHSTADGLLDEKTRDGWIKKAWTGGLLDEKIRDGWMIRMNG